MKIIYIGGYGRSGSTVLDLILGQHKEIVSGGELIHSLKHIQQNKTCTCGAKVSQCKVWRGCSQYLQSQLNTAVDFEEIYASKRAVESLKTLACLLLDLNYFRPPSKKIDSFVLAEQSFDHAFRESGEFQFRVDSSKNARFATARALSLKYFASRDVFFIHLIRHPLAVANSLKKGSNSKLEAGLPSGGSLFMVKGLVGWGFSNIVALLTRLKLGKKKSIYLDFDEFRASPEKSVLDIFNILGLGDGGVIQFLRGNKDQTPLHILSGNRMRNQKLVLSKDNKTKHDLNLFELLFVRLFCNWIKFLCDRF